MGPGILIRLPARGSGPYDQRTIGNLQGGDGIKSVELFASFTLWVGKYPGLDQEIGGLYAMLFMIGKLSQNGMFGAKPRVHQKKFHKKSADITCLRIDTGEGMPPACVSLFGGRRLWYV